MKFFSIVDLSEIWKLCDMKKEIKTIKLITCDSSSSAFAKVLKAFCLWLCVWMILHDVWSKWRIYTIYSERWNCDWNFEPTKFSVCDLPTSWLEPVFRLNWIYFGCFQRSSNVIWIISITQLETVRVGLWKASKCQ